jgi:TATA-binding protein-associated factor
VINQQNAGLASMNTNELFDLFNLSDSKEKKKEPTNLSMKEILEGMEVENNEEDQYAQEYNVENFLSSIKK